MRQEKIATIPADSDTVLSDGGRADQGLAAQLIDALEQGVIFWSKSGLCMMRNSRLASLLELTNSHLPDDSDLTTLMTYCGERGDFRDSTLAECLDRFAGTRSFTFEHHLPSGRNLVAKARPTRGGGFIVSYTDVTDHREAVTALYEAREEAKLAQRQADQILEDERRRQREGHHLATLDEWLQSCQTLEELYRIVSGFMTYALPGSCGQLFIYAKERDVLEQACEWDWQKSTVYHVTPQSCWALRRGRSYQYEPAGLTFPCDHVSQQCGPGELPNQYSCVPIVAHGETVGLLHIQLDPPVQSPDILDPVSFAARCGERISMAIANVRLRDELQDRSDRDPLTDLFNRRVFLDVLRRTFIDAAAEQSSFAVLMLDADHFKTFNDNHGHDAGDAILRAVASEMRAVDHHGATACRLGGEEFALILPKADRTRAGQVADTLCRSIKAMKVQHLSEILPTVTVSIGIAIYPTHGTDATELVKQSDQALYAAKAAGRNTWKVAEGDGMLSF